YMTIRTNFMGLFCIALITLAVSCNNSGSTTTHPTGNVAVQPAHEGQKSVSSSQRQPRAGTEPAATIPDFTFYILKSVVRFTKADLATAGNIVLILFDPTCSHCQHEANDIGQNYDRVKSAHFYFVSMNDPALMASFLNTWAKPLVGKDNVEVLYDSSAEFINKF